MWHQMWIPILIPTLIIKSNCDDNSTNTDVVVHYGGHADADFQYSTTTTTATTITTAEASTTAVPTTTEEAAKTETTAQFIEDDSEDVVFVPNNEPPVTRTDPEYIDRGLRVKDIMMMKSVNDAMSKDFHVEKEVDEPDEGIVFISGKNNDHEEEVTEAITRRKNNNKQNSNEVDKIEKSTVKVKKLNCRNLDCNNTINSICGAKFTDNKWKQRLFMNKCYFRKVNCAFKYEINRYEEVPISECKNIGSHNSERPFIFKPKPVINKPDLKAESNARRTSSSRRSMTTNINGETCSHSCPMTCPDDYEPECAISSSGQRRVFLNHCKLDYDSCYYRVVWHKRPLSECVGGKKADMRQNRGFIGWMQRVGIVDKKGRLVLE